MANTYTLGRGEIWFDRFIDQDDLTPRGERYIGNTPTLAVNTTVETLEHRDSDHAAKDIDEAVTLSTTIAGAFSTDNINRQNMELLLLGRSSMLNSTAITVATVQTLPYVVKGLTYQIGTSDANPSGARKVTSVVVKKGTTALVENTDYTVDLDLARVTILTTGSTVVLGDTLTVEYTAPAQNRQRVISGKDPIAGALRYISFNAVGAKFDWFFPYVKLTPDGEFNLKGDDWQTMNFNMQVLRKTGLEAVYIDGRATVL